MGNLVVYQFGVMKPTGHFYPRREERLGPWDMDFLDVLLKRWCLSEPPSLDLGVFGTVGCREGECPMPQRSYLIVEGYGRGLEIIKGWGSLTAKPLPRELESKHKVGSRLLATTEPLLPWVHETSGLFGVLIAEYESARGKLAREQEQG